MKALFQIGLIFIFILFKAIGPLHAQKMRHRGWSPAMSKAVSQPGEYIAADSMSMSFTVVKRDTSLPVMVFPGKIKQDSLLIANYTVTDGSWEGKLVKTFTFYLPNGVKVAEAMILGISKDACSISTFKDDQMAQIEINAINNTARVQLLAAFLIRKGYL